MNKKIIFIAIFCILFAAQSATAVDFGNNINFNVEENFDASGRSQKQQFW